MKYLFRGGTVVSGRGTRRADVLVEDEKILRVARSISAPEATVIDVEGQLLLPGFIDAHTHFDLDVCSTTTADDFFSGSRSALRGGTTTVVDFACPNKGETLHQGLELWHRKADGSCCCDYGFHMTIDDWNPGIEAEIDDMYAAGISSFKMYMTYPAMMIGDEAMYHALKKLREKGGICGVHCENSGVIDALIAEKKAAGEMGVGSHPRTRPDFLEAEAVSRLLRIAQAVDIPVVIVHLTNAAALREVEAARKRGQRVYVETCPQYLLLDDSVYDDPDYSRAARYVCAPPIRKTEDQRVLWAACARARSRPCPRIIAALPWSRRTPDAGTLPGSPAACRGWRPGASCCIPTALPPGRSAWPPCAGCCRKTPPSSMVCSPGRACSRPGPTRISWCTIPRRTICSGRRT